MNFLRVKCLNIITYKVNKESTPQGERRNMMNDEPVYSDNPVVICRGCGKPVNDDEWQQSTEEDEVSNQLDTCPWCGYSRQ